MISETNPETGLTTYVYDTDTTCGTYAGNLVKRTDAVGNVTCYAYDSLHRPTSITYPSGSYSSTTPKKYFVYDATAVNGIAISNALGRLAEAYTCTGNCTSKITDLWYSYSKRGELTDAYEVTPHSGGTYHLTQSYWEHGGPKALAGLSGLPTITYGATDGSGLDGDGRITKITASTGANPLTGAIYTLSGTTQPIGSLTQLTLGSSDTDNFSYDPNTGRMTQYKFNIGSAPQSVVGNLTWNANGSLNTLQITDPFNSGSAQTCSFTHDDLARVATANCGTAWNQSFSFDPFGNVTKTGSISWACPTCYDASTNRYNSTLSPSISYDANGDLTHDTSHAYTWDADGNMLNVDSGTSGGVCDTYDALGRMVEKATGTSCTTSYTEIVYAPSGIRLATMTGQTLQQASVPLLGGAEAVYNSGGLLAYRHSDHLGSSRFASTPSRTKYFDVAYAPYGEDYADSGTTDLSFTGQKKETTSWLYDFMFRKYNAAHGRWMSPDPLGVGAVSLVAPQTWNRYAYVANGPMNSLDPLGLKETPSCRISQDVGCGGFDGSGVYVDGVELPNFSGLGGELIGSGAGVDITTAITTTIIGVPYIEIGGSSATCTAEFCGGVDHLDFGASIATYTEYLPSLPGLGWAGAPPQDGAGAPNNGSSKQSYLSVKSDHCSATGRDIHYQLNGATGYVWEILTYSNGSVANNTQGATLNGYPDFISIWGTHSPISQQFVMSAKSPKPGAHGTPVQIQQNVGGWNVMLDNQIIQRTNDNIYVAGNACPK
jgi:RHS repeat-associated protein